MPREKSAGAIIFRREQDNIYYLLLQYGKQGKRGGHWEFAKGHVEQGETEKQTVKREVFEETGLNDIKIISGFVKYSKYFFKAHSEKKDNLKKNKKPSWIFKLVTFFIAETKTKKIKLSPEHIGFIWLPFKDAFKKTTFKNSKLLLKEANDFITKHYTR